MPSPVGPSKPAAAVHSSDGEQLPLLPVVTSFRFAVCEYGNDGGLSVAAGVPARVLRPVGPSGNGAAGLRLSLLEARDGRVRAWT